MVPLFSLNAFVWESRAVTTFENIFVTTHVGFPVSLYHFSKDEIHRDASSLTERHWVLNYF